jgi:hypothetical protein
VNCTGDADSPIVKTALKAAQRYPGPVTVVADDTAIIEVMLVHHWRENMSNVFFLQQLEIKLGVLRKLVPEIESLKNICFFLHS